MPMETPSSLLSTPDIEMDSTDGTLGCERDNEDLAVSLAPVTRDPPTDDETLMAPPILSPKRNKKLNSDRDTPPLQGRTRSKARTSKPPANTSSA